jgi:hypothetical protein
VGNPLAPSDLIRVNVIYPRSLRRSVLLVNFAELGSDEVVFDGYVFTVRYSLSIVSVGTSNSLFVIQRKDGWPTGATVSLRAIAIDTYGQEAA